MAAASAHLFEARTHLLRAEDSLRYRGGALDAADLAEASPTKGPRNAGGSPASRRVASAFKLADHSGDKRVDRDEFRKFAAQLGGAGRAHADTLFNIADTNGDGKLDAAEFKSAVAVGRTGAVELNKSRGASRGAGSSGPTAGMRSRTGLAPKTGSNATRASRIPSRGAVATSAPPTGGGSRLPKVGGARGASAGPKGPKVHGLPEWKAAEAGAASSSEEQAAAETPMPAGGAYHAASAFPAYMQHAVHNPAYAAAYAQQYAQVQQAQQQAMLQQMTLASQYPPAYGMGMWQQNVPQQQ